MLKTHVRKGYQIAMSSPDLSPIAEMILHHHERWDGNGYPDHLKAEQIPVLSRIISVVDAFDAMVNDRVYRPAMSTDEAIHELKRCSGTQFDPKMVEAFTVMLKEDSQQTEKPKEILKTIDDHKKKEREKIEFTKTDSVVNKSWPDEKEPGIGKAAIYSVSYTRYQINQNQRIIAADEQFEVFTGYGKQDWKEYVLTQIDLIPEEDRSEYIAILKKRLQGNDFAYFEHRLRRKDGHILTVLCQGRVYYNSALKEKCSEIIIVERKETYKP